MTIINTSPDRIIPLGYEGEDRVTVLRFRYGAEWLENGSGIFNIRVRRHGEQTAYNAAFVADDAENNCLLMTVTDVELSVRGSGEMQIVYSGADFVKKSPVYSYHVSSAIDGDPVDPPAGSIINQIIRDLAEVQSDLDSLVDNVSALDNAIDDLQTAVQGKADFSTVSALAETVEGIPRITVDSELSASSKNPVQNSAIYTALSGKASTATATTSTNGLMSAQDKSRLDAVYADYSAALTALGGGA